MTRTATNTPKVATFGESLGLVHVTGPGGFRQARKAELGFGGAESNVAIGLSRLGVDVTWFGRLGNDAVGDLIERELRAEAVTASIVRDPVRSTALMLKEHVVAGSTQITYYRAGSAGSLLAPGDVDETVIAAADLLHVTGVTPALSETARSTTTFAIGVAAHHQVPVCFDLNHRSKLWTAHAAEPVYRAIAAKAHLLFAGIDEARILVPHERDPERLAIAVADLGPRIVVLKLGAAGCLTVEDGVVGRQPAVLISPVDTVGAGDAFVAGFLAGWLRGDRISACAAQAVIAGAFACMSDGDWEGSPRAKDLLILTAEEPVSR